MHASSTPIGEREELAFMSIIAFPGPDKLESCAVESLQPIKRRGSLEQGRALETLGHAVEYLVDSRLFHAGCHNQTDEQEAIQILMRMSRAVFSECPEVVTLGRRLGRWVSDRLTGGSAASNAARGR
jgi:hypothetical protein